MGKYPAQGITPYSIQRYKAAGPFTTTPSDVGNAVGVSPKKASTDIFKIHPNLIAGHLYSVVFAFNITRVWTGPQPVIVIADSQAVGASVDAGGGGSTPTPTGAWAFTTQLFGQALGAQSMGLNADAEVYISGTPYINYTPLFYINSDTTDLLRPPSANLPYYVAPFNITTNNADIPTGNCIVKNLQLTVIDFGFIL